MELHQLRYFLSVARTGSFTRAAERCSVSQPSLSQQVQKLERQIGQRLFDRLGHKVALTDAGRLLLGHAEAILAAVDEAEQRLKDFDPLQGGHLTIGALPTIAPYVLPCALQGFLKRCPRVEVNVREDLTRQLVPATVAGELDLALVALPVDDEHLEVQTLHTEPLLLALPRGHTLARKKSVTLADVRQERFILLNDIHCLGEQVLSFCREQDCQRIACVSTQLSTVQSLIALGLGVSLLPAMARRADSSGSRVYRPLADVQASRTIAAIWNRNRYHNPAAKQFLAQVRDLAALWQNLDRAAAAPASP
jgi:LysR family hydrogen peroxide-inducible transcriptional activator